ncbi:MAG: hypothetical protein JWO30_2209 [Fibrobacteres bacterium]|nr:hypothetical protein [Fibrobacterota bacterium]
MKLSIPTVRLLTGLGLTAGLFLGCQNILDQSKDNAAADPVTTTDDASLRLSIKDDSTCREQWGVILNARTSGHADSAAEAAFLSACVKEVKATDKGIPVIPPNLVPDSNTRCHWIVSQIEGGREEMTVSYKRYCPEDCRKLEIGDSARHEKLCREPGEGPGKDPGEDTCRMLREKLELVKPGEAGRTDLEHMFLGMCKDSIPKPPHDTIVNPPRPNPYEDTCRMIKAKLELVKPGEPGRADLEHLYAAMCKEWIPIDSLPKPPRDTVVVPPKDTLPKPPVVNCDELRKKLLTLDTASADYKRLKGSFREHCPEKPPVPVDTIVRPPKDTSVLPPVPHDSICMDLKLRLGASVAGSAARSELEAKYKSVCMEPQPPVVAPPVVNCDELRKKLMSMDPASADYVRIQGSLKEHCPEKP